MGWFYGLKFHLLVNEKGELMGLHDKYLLKKRTLVETIIDFLKNIFDLWHTRHRSTDNGFNNAVACLAANSFLDQKPSISDHRIRNFVLFLEQPSN